MDGANEQPRPNNLRSIERAIESAVQARLQRARVNELVQGMDKLELVEESVYDQDTDPEDNDVDMGAR